MRVLLIEHDKISAHVSEQMLRQSKLDVYSTESGEEGVEFSQLYDYDIIILELHLPDISGYEVLKQLRSARVYTPILVCTAVDDADSMIRAFGLGADDYVTKPFHREVLLARIFAIIRRSKGFAKSSIDIGTMTININDKAVFFQGTEIVLTVKEYLTLEILCLNKGRVVTRESFLNHLYEGRDEPIPSTVDAHVSRLRRKLAKAGVSNCTIKAVSGRGYKILMNTNI